MLYLELPVRLVILFRFIQFNSVYFMLIQINRHGLSPFNMPGTSSVSCFRKRQKMCDSFCTVLTAGPREANRLFLEPRRHLLSLRSKKASWSRSLDLG